LRLGMVLVAVLVAACLGAASAAAAPADLKFDPADGAALPSGGGKVQVSLVCEGDSKKDCKGRIEILGRGGADDLHSVLAGGPAAVAVDHTEDQLLTLTQEAHDYLREVGPIPVEVVIRRPDGSTESREFAIEEPKLVSLGAPTVAVRGRATASTIDDLKTYSWSRNLRGGTALEMGEFRCPADFPLVAGGKGIWYGRAGRVDLNASEGVGYAAFDNVIEKPYWNADDFTGLRVWSMVGWWAGNLFRNSIWAPPFKPGTFTLTISCTRMGYRLTEGEPDRPAFLYQEPWKGGFPSVSTFMPWVMSSRTL
jgi:hypothetical protein